VIVKGAFFDCFQYIIESQLNDGMRYDLLTQTKSDRSNMNHYISEITGHRSVIRIDTVFYLHVVTCAEIVTDLPKNPHWNDRIQINNAQLRQNISQALYFGPVIVFRSSLLRSSCNDELEVGFLQQRWSFTYLWYR